MTINERERLFAYSLGVILRGELESSKTVIEILHYLHEEGRFEAWAKKYLNLQYGVGQAMNTKDTEETSGTRPEVN